MPYPNLNLTKGPTSQPPFLGSISTPTSIAPFLAFKGSMKCEVDETTRRRNEMLFPFVENFNFSASQESSRIAGAQVLKLFTLTI
jgi:hypothetical protein